MHFWNEVGPKRRSATCRVFFSSDRKIEKILELKKNSSVNWTSFASFKKKNGQILYISKLGKMKKKWGGGGGETREFTDQTAYSLSRSYSIWNS
jgi:hypothetical protein